MTGSSHGTAVLLLYLLLAAAYGGVIEVDRLETPLQEVSLSKDFLRLPGDSAEVSLANGMLWGISLGGRPYDLFPEGVPKWISCPERGIFPLKDSCHDFYFCEDLASEGNEDMVYFWFTCPEGNVFDADALRCTTLSLVTSRPECHLEVVDPIRVEAGLKWEVPVAEDIREEEEEEEAEARYEFLVGLSTSSGNFSELDHDYRIRKGHLQNRKTRSTDAHNMKKVDLVVETAKEACVDVKNIDSYISHIKSKDSLTVPYFDDEMLTNIMKEYNHVLKTAQQNTIKWKDIRVAIEETFLLTREFEPKFTKNLRDMNQRVAIILSQKKEVIALLETYLEQVNEDIKNTQEILNSTASIEVDSFILKGLKEMLEAKKEDHRRLLKEYNLAKKEIEFQELTGILESVKNKCVEIKNKATITKLRMEEFQDKMIEDSGNFQKSHARAETGIQTIQECKINNDRDMARLRDEKRRLSTRINEEQNSINNLNRQIRNNERRMEEEMAKQRRILKSARAKQRTGTILLIVPVVGWIAGGTLIGISMKDSKEAYAAMNRASNDYRIDMQIHRRLISMQQNDINVANNRLNELERKASNFQRELPQLTVLNNHLNTLQGDVGSLLPFLSRAIASLESLKNVFLSTEEDLVLVIDNAKKAHTKAQRRIASYFMYHTIDDDIKVNWENARDKIIPVGQCVSSS